MTLESLKARLRTPGAQRVLIVVGAATAAVVAGLGIGLAVMVQQLPEIDQLTDYRPKQPLRVYTADGVEIGQYGAERRIHVPIAQIPKLMQDAVLAIEDRRFRDHAGIDVKGVMRALVANLTHTRSQGASTITQQVARTFYLSSSKTYSRKVREMLLALKIERQLTKDQVLELYMNQIYLGQRAYGFAAASQAYFGKSMDKLSIAEVAMLAGLPQNPAHANPVSNPERAHKRQLVVLDSMETSGVIDAAQHQSAKAQPLVMRRTLESTLHAEHAAEMARQVVHAKYGEEAYTRGLKVYTTLKSDDQEAAYRAVRKGLIDYERRQPYRGPEDNETIADGVANDDPSIADLLVDHDDDDDLRVAIVTSAAPTAVVATLVSGESVRITADGLRLARSALSPKAKAAVALHRGSVIRVMKTGKLWAIAQWPQAEAALTAMEPQTGRLHALVGGFDFVRNQFNHVSQAQRQPGSSFKPFVYSAAMEHGVMPATLINDAPLDLSNEEANGWQPRNSDGLFDGPITLRQALARSKNLVSIRLVREIGVGEVQQWAGRFGFTADKLPNNLTLALGTGSATPMQMATAYAMLANGGLRVEPVLIERIVGADGQVLFEAPPHEMDEAQRVIPARNAFLIGRLLQEVTRSGTAAKAQAQLKRDDLYGKTGTTDDAVDAWFAGYQPGLATVVWMGYDNPRSLGERESGGGLALPIWIDFMKQALKNVPIDRPVAPEGLAQVNGEWVYSEWAEGGFITGIGLDEPAVAPAPGLFGTPASAPTSSDGFPLELIPR
jgi:penicillin-binding protein 1A